MLKGIPSIIPPELLKILAEMGHGDEIVLGDGNFPAHTCGKRVVRCDGHGIPELLEAILQLFPLDTYCVYPVALMEVVPGDNYKPVIWEEYHRILEKTGNFSDKIEYVERFDFYERAKQTFAVVSTGESALYANIILKKGVVTE